MKLKFVPPLDPEFLPAAIFNQNYLRVAKQSGRAVPLMVGIERENGLVSRYFTCVLPEAETDTLRFVERLVKVLLWARGGWRIWFGGPRLLGEHIAQYYNVQGARKFDVELMSRVYEHPFEVVITTAEEVPPAKELDSMIGGHLDGCRIGFDLGASDFKVAAVNDGKVVFADEFPWNPKDEPNPQYHYDHLSTGIKKAAAYLPRVDAIGGSSAGVIVSNKFMVASILRGVPVDKFGGAKNLFLRLREEWKVPLEVANDGDVTALAGAMSLKENGMLGVAMGSSEAAGYLNPLGCMTGWLTEFAFVPVDYNPTGGLDEWSGDRGGGVMYFSQQAVNKLLPAAGILLPPEISQPERLKEVQHLMAKGDVRAAKIYETIGIYLGYTIPHYADFYDFQHMLILGRVTTGQGGDIVIAKAREVLAAEFPEMAEKIQLHVPDEKSRRVGQAVAAASLPKLRL